MVSIVVPLFNERESLQILYEEIVTVASKFDCKYEIIFVDDGSTDGSLKVLRGFEKEDDRVRVFSFRKNQGKAEALTFGFQKAKGDYIVTLDADLQDRPDEIPKLLEKAKDGWDVVCGWRKNRHDPSLKIFSSQLFNFIARLFWNVNLHDYNCGLKIYTRNAAKSLNLYGGLHRFIPVLLYQRGFLVTEMQVMHNKRQFGKSKYGFSRLWKDFPDIITALFLSRYSKRPLHFFGVVGLFLFLAGVIILCYLSIIHFQGHTIGRRPLLFLGMLLIIAGFQILFTGLLADLIINISHNSGSKNNEDNQLLLKYSSD